MHAGRLAVDVEPEVKVQFREMCKKERLTMSQAVNFMIIAQLEKGCILKEDVVK